MNVVSTELTASAAVPLARTARKILFVSSTTTGGSGRSQRELAAALVARGRSVRFLVDPGAQATMRRRVLEEFTDATARWRSSALGRPIDHVRARLGAQTSRRRIDGLDHDTTLAPENAFPRLVRCWRPDVVVVSSISRVTWRAIRTVCRQRGIPTVLHLREATAIGHLSAGLLPDVLLANSGTLVEDAERLGYRAELVPSLVEVARMSRPPTGEVAVLVNPLSTHGIDLVDPLARALPGVPIVLQESWILDRAQRAVVDRLVRDHTNVSFRAFDPRPDLLFRDAAVLLAPHRLDNRPRTVLEAQTNGVPVIASDQPGLVEAVGEGGLLIDRSAGPDEWIRALGGLWQNDERLRTLGESARVHAARPEVRPAEIAARFLEIVDVLAREERGG